ncbi:MAG: M24 family metallopeptidase, partial [Aquincola sp.]|nr:M24 family metallopeptidase [Aquincola sp.]
MVDRTAAVRTPRGVVVCRAECVHHRPEWHRGHQHRSYHQRGDLIMLDFGVGYLSMWTDQKRIAYVLKPGETALPASYQRAFDNAIRVRDVIHRTARPGRTAQVMMDSINRAIVNAGILANAGLTTRPGRTAALSSIN